MAHTMDKSTLSELGETFVAMDTNNEGTININEFKDAIGKTGRGGEMSDEGVGEIFRALDQDVR